MTALDHAVLDGLRARLADTEARLAATEQALAEARALLARRDAGGVAVSTADGGGARTGEPATSAPCQCGAPVGTLRAGRCDDCAFDALGGE